VIKLQLKTFVLILSCFFSSFAQDKILIPQIPFNPKTYICLKSNSEILIDGILREPEWEKIKWTDSFVDIEGQLKPQPRFETRVKMLWDENYFYVGAELEEPNLWATLQQRDTVIYQDNDFEVFLDPDGDSHLYYELEINALNTVWDLLLIKPYRDGGPAINSWDISGLKSAVHLCGSLNEISDIDSGWTIELAIPWAVLSELAGKNTPPSPGDYWRINYSRVEWKTEVVHNKYQKIVDERGNSLPEDNWVWSPQGLINMHYPEMWGFVLFSDESVFFAVEDFEIPDIEIIKWSLRQVYYFQKNYFELKKRFAAKNEIQNEFKFLGLDFINSIDFNITQNSFEVIYQRINSGEFIKIDETGKILTFSERN
jgi:hypothetical protein